MHGDIQQQNASKLRTCHAITPAGPMEFVRSSRSIVSGPPCETARSVLQLLFRGLAQRLLTFWPARSPSHGTTVPLKVQEIALSFIEKNNFFVKTRLKWARVSLRRIHLQEQQLMIRTLRLCVVLTVLSTATFVHANNVRTTTPPVSTPTITSISPLTAYVNSASFTLTVNGTNFVSGALVYFGYSGIPLTTTFISSTKLTAEVPASDLTSENTDGVYVTNPGSLSSNTVNFYVVGLDPSVSGVTPIDAVAGSTPGVVTVNGYNFASGATILWNGRPVSTTFVNSGQLTFTPTKSQLAAPRIVPLAVSNPTPGGLSATINFDVTYPAKTTVLDLPANDIVWDPYAQRIYASLPSSYGINGNTIAVVNPYTGKVVKYYFAGSEPNQLALATDSKYLYVGLNGNGSVQRLILPSFTLDIDVPLTGNSLGSADALSLGVSPSDDHTFAVAEGTAGCCFSYGLYFYTDSTELANFITYPQMSDIVFADGSTLYGYESGTVSAVAVDSSGGTLTQQWNGLLTGTAIAYASGLIDGNSGQVLNPSTGLLVGTYDFGNTCCGTIGIVPDTAIDRMFAVGNTPFFNFFGITAYDLQKFTPLAVTDLSQLAGSAVIQTFLHWGNNGLAFVLSPGCCNTVPQLVLVQSSAMFSTTSKNPAPNAQELTPASATHGTGNLLVGVKGANFVPNSQVTWNGTLLFADYVSPTQLNLYVPAASLSKAGTANVIVTNPFPGGGVSTPLTFTIN